MITITAGSGKGAETDTRTGFFGQVLPVITDISGPLIIAGPGFIKDDFVNMQKTGAARVQTGRLLSRHGGSDGEQCRKWSARERSKN